MKLIVIRTQGYGSRRADGVGEPSQLWHRTKLRRDSRCAGCGGVLGKGGEAFSPITNALNRADRLCPECAEKHAMKVLS